MDFKLTKVISGGQTGADQAGLSAAFKSGLPTGGTAPEGYYTENGPNPLLELLGLSAKGDYRSRTIQNIKDSSGTVLLSVTLNSPGSVLTRNESKRQGKPYSEHNITNLVKLLDGDGTPEQIRAEVLAISCDVQFFIVDKRITVLNVAGNREKSTKMSTTKAVELVLMDAFKVLRMSGLVQEKEFT